MVDFGQAIRDYVRFGYCTSIGNIATFGEIFGGGGNPIGFAGVQAARFLHNQFCNMPAPEPLPPPFTGGQCPTLYDVTVTMTRTSGTIQNPFTPPPVRVNGPVSGATFRNQPGNATTLDVIAAPDSLHPDGFYTAAQVPTNFGGGENVNSCTIVSVVRVDGQPDNCGSLPPTVPPYVPGSNSTTNNITYTTDEGDNISIPTTITFGYGRLGINGTLNIPFTLNLNVTPTVNITGNLNLNTGDVEYNVGNPALPPSSCGGNSDDYVPSPDDIPPVSPGNPDVPDPIPDPVKPQTRKLMTAALVTVTTVPKSVTEIFQSGNPNVLAPDAGLISFQISVGGYTGWTEDIRIKNIRQIVPVPWKGGAIDVKGTPREGGQFTITPIYERITLGAGFPA